MITHHEPKIICLQETLIKSNDTITLNNFASFHHINNRNSKALAVFLSSSMRMYPIDKYLYKPTYKLSVIVLHSIKLLPFVIYIFPLMTTHPFKTSITLFSNSLNLSLSSVISMLTIASGVQTKILLGAN